jgi:putative transposase
MRKIEFITSDIYLYHIYNRGVDKRNIFLENDDYVRFIHDLFEFNDIRPAREFSRAKDTMIDQEKRKLKVEILAFCLMPNHFHLLLKQKEDRGIKEFMHKIGTGYTMYFNRKNKRSGVLFQGRFKAKLIDNEPYFKYMPHYIHTNALDLFQFDWREQGIKDTKKALKFLEKYRWSSCLDYLGKKNFRSVISRNFINSIWKNSGHYRQGLIEYLRNRDMWEAEPPTYLG